MPDKSSFLPVGRVYSRLLVRHPWLVLNFVVLFSIVLTIVGIAFTQLPDFSDPRKGWGARGKGTIFSQLMVLRHAAERFRLAYELPLENYELFGSMNQFSNVTLNDLDEDSYRSDILMKYDIWKKKKSNELIDYSNLKDDFYQTDFDDEEIPEYEDDSIHSSASASLYQWHRDKHFDVENLITKYVDDKMINITVLELVKNLPQFNRSNYQSARLPFDLFRPYAYLLEEKYRGRTGREGMIEFYIERTNPNTDLLSLEHLQSICQWERKFKGILSLNNTPSLSLATFVALYNSKTDCQLLTSNDVKNFRSILHTCLPYYFNGYMDIPLSEQFLNRVILEHQPGYFTHQEQVKAIYTTLRHTCFYKNITRLIFDHFVDKQFLYDFALSKNQSKVALSMIYISNYQSMKLNRTRDLFMCLRRQPYSRQYCEQRGCIKDVNNNLLVQSCADQAPPKGTCVKYCQCKYQCANETEQVVVMKPIYKGQDLIDLFEKYFAGKRQLPTYRDEFVKLIALNFANVRERAAMARISEDMLLVLIATALIIGITVLYLRSVSIALIIVLGAALSIGGSYFIYRVIYQIPIFPFMNLMSAFILIGIGCDDIFVFFDTWDQEKMEWLRKYQMQHANELSIPLNEIELENLPKKKRKLKVPSNAFQTRHRTVIFNDPEEMRKLLLSEEALIEIMAKTLKHAGSSMFVTSLTTSAAFFTNMLTNISFIQVFGVFTGTCILLYFLITVTAIAAFAVIYEKYIQNLLAHILSIRLTNVVDTSSNNSSMKICRKFATVARDVRNAIFGHYMPMIIINLRFLLVLLFLCMGILGLVGVFNYPKLRVPSTQKVAFFLKDNPMEIYEFAMKNYFNGYAKEEKRLFAYPSVSFIFGIRDIDDGYLFDMNDRGKLHLMSLGLEKQTTLEFFKEFITHLGTRADLFGSNYDLEKDFESFYQLSTDNILVSKIIDDRTKQNISNTSQIEMIRYLVKLNSSLAQNLVRDTVRTVNYREELDHSDHEDFIDPKVDKINKTLNRLALKQLNNSNNPKIIFTNYRKLFNKTLEKYYSDQIQRTYNLSEIRQVLNGTIRDQLTEGYHRSALKTAMQCLTGEAGANNVPPDFCERQLNKQRSVNWAVLPDKPSPIDGSVRPFAVIITIRGALNRTNYDSYNSYYFKIKHFFDPYIRQHAPEHLQHAWFSSPGFAFYGVQRELLVGTYSSLIASLGIALLVLFLTSGNLFIALYALITITFAIAVSVAIFAALKWELGIVEAIIVIMSVGLSVDFVVHFGVGYIHTDPTDIERERKRIHQRYTSVQSSENPEIQTAAKISTVRLLYKEHQIERETRVNESISRVGSAVFMAAFTTFAAGFSMTLSSLTSFRQMGQFLMTIMLTSWMFAMFFFLPLCAILGPVGQCGSIPFGRIGQYFKRLFTCFRRSQ